MKRKEIIEIVAAAVIAAGMFGASACLDFGNNTAGPSQVNVQTVTVPTAIPPAATVAPTPVAGACAISPASTRLAPFGFDGCSNPPANDAHSLPSGCTALLTATPKDAANVDYPDSLPIHTSVPVWTVSGPATLSEYLVGGQPENFNKKATRTGPGAITVTATVCGVQGTWTAAN